ncbi:MULTISPECIES: hypothetical protein [unclassified Mycobacterium]|uniref:hypothetical protein n=1 Tax=unclassified Mycobacterium TaxID=2642494 RepID=UPI0029C8AE3B|nr:MULTISPECIES: hypothetical protein [unclassified Mycobacterium]
MPELPLPPFLRALTDQMDARNRDVLDAALKVYREHADEVHGGDPSPCGQAILVFRHMGLIPGGPEALSQERCNAVLAYAVERLFILERELARRIAADQ